MDGMLATRKDDLSEIVRGSHCSLEPRNGRVLDHTIPLKPVPKPEAKQPYRLSRAELVEVHTLLTTLVNQGWIRPSFSTWGAAILLQLKKDGKLRMCIYCHALNNHAMKSRLLDAPN